MFDEVGSDAMRWAMLASAAVRGGDMAVDRRPIEEAVRQALLPIWNTWYFLSLYANAEGLHGSSVGDAASPRLGHPLDRYALAKARQLVDEVTARMDAYDLSGACSEVLAYLDSLTNWYVRRSRDRFWAGDQAAVDTLHTVLEVLCRVSAPLLPLLTDTIWPALTGESSVHLADWPSPDALPDDPELVAAMDAVRDVCSAASSIRKAERLRVRLPLSTLVVAAPDAERLAPYVDLIKDEVNVKRVELTPDVSAAAETQLVLVPRVLGPRVGSGVQALLAAVKEGRWDRDPDGRVVVEGRALEPDEFELRLVPKEGAAAAPLPGGAGVVALDTVVTPEMEAEGLARDVARLVNQVRRDEGLHVSDRIRLVVDCDGHHDVATALRTHDAFLRDETLADELVVIDADHHHPEGSHRHELSDGRAVHIGLSRLP